MAAWSGASPSNRCSASARAGRSPPTPGEESEGKIARYAGGDDYHEVIRAKLQKLSCGIQEEFRVGDGQHRPCVDTGPLLEREIAYRAGVLSNRTAGKEKKRVEKPVKPSNFS